MTESLEIKENIKDAKNNENSKGRSQDDIKSSPDIKNAPDENARKVSPVRETGQPENDIVIRLSGITKKYNGQEAIENATYSVSRGTVFALLGENGAGKTTTIKILLGMAVPEAGSVSVLDLNPIHDDLEIRRRVGCVPEQPALYEWMTVAQIGQFAAAFHPEGYWEEFRRAAEAFDLDLSAKIKGLSKGMKAEVSLALALGADPDLLILDEPTSGLDAVIRRKFLENMVERAALGKTVFLSSHQIAEVERIADTVALMKKSRVLLVEPLEELKASTAIFRIIFKESVPEDENFGAGFFEELVDRRIDGRELQLLGRRPRPDALAMIQNSEDVAEVERRAASLEEIFIAYMR